MNRADRRLAGVEQDVRQPTTNSHEPSAETVTSDGPGSTVPVPSQTPISFTMRLVELSVYWRPMKLDSPSWLSVASPPGPS